MSKKPETTTPDPAQPSAKQRWQNTLATAAQERTSIAELQAKQETTKQRRIAALVEGADLAYNEVEHRAAVEADRQVEAELQARRERLQALEQAAAAQAPAALVEIRQETAERMQALSTEAVDMARGVVDGWAVLGELLRNLKQTSNEFNEANREYHEAARQVLGLRNGETLPPGYALDRATAVFSVNLGELCNRIVIGAKDHNIGYKSSFPVTLAAVLRPGVALPSDGTEATETEGLAV